MEEKEKNKTLYKIGEFLVKHPILEHILKEILKVWALFNWIFLAMLAFKLAYDTIYK